MREFEHDLVADISIQEIFVFLYTDNGNRQLLQVIQTVSEVQPFCCMQIATVNDQSCTSCERKISDGEAQCFYEWYEQRRSCEKKKGGTTRTIVPDQTEWIQLVRDFFCVRRLEEKQFWVSGITFHRKGVEL